MPSPREAAHEGYKKLFIEAQRLGETHELTRELAKKDIFFLLIYILGVTFGDNDWVFKMCREVQKNPDGHLDLWSREHFKTTIAMALIIQDILNDPEVTIGIFSFNRPIAKGFLRPIKWQFEQNEKLKELFPEVCWNDPQKEAPKWSEDDGIIVRREGTPKEATIEAWGVIDGQPTSKHFRVMVFDDVVTKESVSTPEMSTKVTDSVSMAFNLGSNLGGRRRFYGTRYHYADTYSVLIARGAVIPRVYGATTDGTPSGEPWLWSRETLEEKIRDMGPYISSCQLFNKPIQEGDEVFLEGWVKYWIPDMRNMQNMNKYIVVDPANEKKENSDYTVMAVIGLGPDGNYYLIDMIRDRLNLEERTNRLFKLHSVYKPLAVGYEKYGMQSDIQHFQSEMNRKNYRFTIIPLGGGLKKNDRIKRLQPLFQTGRFYIPESLIRVDTKGVQHDLVAEFMQDEYRQFPYMTHDDMLDCISRICDPDMNAFNPDGPSSVESWADEHRATEEYDYDVYSYIS